MFKTIFGRIWMAYVYLIFGVAALLSALSAFVMITFSRDELKKKAHKIPLYASRSIL